MRADNISLVSFLIILGLMYLGVIKHWWNMRKTRRTTVSLWTYMIFGDKKKQGAKIGAVLITALTTASVGLGDWVDPSILWAVYKTTGTFSPAAILVGLGYVSTGYAIDSEGNNLQVAKS